MSVALLARYGLTQASGGGGALDPRSTNFADYTTGVAPSDWTDVLSTGATWTVESVASAPSGKALQAVVASNVQDGLVWDVPAADGDSSADVEVLALVRQTGAGGAFDGCGPIVRQTANASYMLTMRGSSLVMYRTTGTSDSNRTFITGGGIATTADVWYWTRLRANGSTISIKQWADGDAEPGTFAYSVTNTAITAAGGAGLLIRRDSATETMQCGFFSYAFGGDTAPGLP